MLARINATLYWGIRSPKTTGSVPLTSFAHMDRANTRAVLIPFCDARRVVTVCEKFDDLKTT